MATHRLDATRENLHGLFSPDLPPVLTVDAGDTVRFETLDAGWYLAPVTGDPERDKVFQREPGRDDGHALTGPVAIRGAEPGMTLEIEIGEAVPGPWGWTRAGRVPTSLNQRLGVAEQAGLLSWTLDLDRMVGRNQLGYEIPLRPFMGLMGMPPADPGLHRTRPPRVTGGNLDCKELIAGSRLYLPIAVPGALFSTGDGHAAQADGEVSGTSIECPMERVDLTFHLRDDLRLTTPRADTPAGWITFGIHPDLDEAMVIALEAMLDLMGELFDMTRIEALAMASVTVDFHITQVVNEIPGVHAILPRGVISRTRFR
jgi:acetamidase/formamidase